MIAEVLSEVPDTIAIDGPAASGKSTVAECLAKKLGYLFFDTGIMYRALTLAAIQRQIAVDDAESLSRLADDLRIEVLPPSQADGRSNDILLDGEDVTWQIRSPEVNARVSPVSVHPDVRKAMTRQQRRIGERGKVVMVGRDIGTVVMPDADLKIFLDASAEVRAQRRYLEALEQGQQQTYEQILDSIRQRDEVDSSRAVAPLVAAGDAVTLHTDSMTKEEVLNTICKLWKGEPYV